MALPSLFGLRYALEAALVRSEKGVLPSVLDVSCLRGGSLLMADISYTTALPL